MGYLRQFTVVLGVLSCGIAIGRAEEPKETAAPKAEPGLSRFLRLVRDKEGTPEKLETAVVSYRAAEGEVQVDLVSAVHIGEASYYEELNELFKQYDVVLYELVAPKGTRVPRGGGNSDNPLSLLQGLATEALDLSSQTAKINYQAENFVHADMSPDEIAETLRKRGDDALTMTLRVAADLLQQQNLQARRAEKEGKPSEEVIDPLALLFDPEAPQTMKRAFAEQFASGAGPEAFGPTLQGLLITDRNAAALKELGRQLAGGKKKIAIFYGAAHMADFEERLGEDYGLTRRDVRWITAWDLLKKPSRAGGLFGG